MILNREPGLGFTSYAGASGHGERRKRLRGFQDPRIRVKG
jgi:hypothetical protein